MAASAVQKQLLNIVECSVCCETYSDPRQLPCIHSYCLKCIREVSRDKLPGDAVACPLCRKNFIVPQNGIDGLPKNFFMEQLKALSLPSSTYCEVCSASETKAAVRKSATMFCVDCSERLCETCADIHRSMKATKGHELVEQDSGNESDDARVRVARVHCDKHKEKVLELYCFDCRTTICMMCFVQSHQMHKCSDLNVVADEFRREMTGDIVNMVDTVARCRGVIEEEQRNKEKFNNKVKEIEREICGHVDKQKQLIDQEKSKLLKELESFKGERNKQIDNVVEEMKQHVSFVESLRMYTEQIRDKGRSGDVTQQRSSLQNRANELTKLDGMQRAVNELGSIDVTFTAATWPTSSGDIVGKISKKSSEVNSGARLLNTTSSRVPCPLSPTIRPVNNSSGEAAKLMPTSSGEQQTAAMVPADSSSGKATKIVPRPQRTTSKHSAKTSLSHVISSDGRGEVVGLTVCNEKIFVLRGRREEIEQYNVNTFRQLTSITVKGLNDDYWSYRSMTSCNMNNCLYVNNSSNVFRVDLFTNNVISWPVDGCPCELSVNRTSNVLVTCLGDDTIKEYSTNGSFVRSIQLQKNHVTRPLHTVQLTDCQYVVCHHGPKIHGVSLIDQQGTFIATYKNNGTTGPMDEPEWIVIVNNCILVADVNNNRILQLNSSLSDARELQLPVNSRLNRPYRMYFDESSDRLFVGECEGEYRVLVFDNINC